ncbi:MAG: DegT/DnrJ/EryC1/StrS aminotransferase family protein [Deltaproteobacteria bacterium]|nr:DegT/DnrJ/EryC1/StrS aminotransferase family protein [Deltaproteobacteria bacterium]
MPEHSSIKRATFLPFSPPLIGEEEIAEVVDTLRSGWITTGPKTKRFETDFAAYINAPAALALNSGTAALHIALAVLGIGPGDAVVTTPMTFCSTVHVIEQVGAQPILVDVEPDTLNISPSKVAEVIKKFQVPSSKFQVKAILPVHLYGHPCDMDAIGEIAQKYELAVLEDAAHALPAKYKGRFIGSGNNLTAFSFYATKNLTTAEGGMLTGAVELLERARVLSLHGMSRDAWKRYDKGGSWRYEVIAPGFKYNMTDIQASLGLWQLKKLDRFQQRRRQVVAAYNQAFGCREELEIPVERPGVEHAWHIYALRLRPETLRIDRDQFINELTAQNIGTSVHFMPIPLHPYYRDKYGYRPEDFPVAYENYLRLISLPLNPRLTDQDVNDVIEAVLDIVKQHRR